MFVARGLRALSAVGLGAKLLCRAVELAWLYLPLLPLACWAWAFDLLDPRHGKGFCGSRTRSELFWQVALRRVQRSGPVFVKLGQWAATRPDLIPEEWCTALGALHDGTDSHSLEHTHHVLNRAFTGAPWYKSLLIEPRPVGSGCIAQVYVGYLVDVDSHCPRASAPLGCGAGWRWFGRRGGASVARQSLAVTEHALESPRRCGARKVAVKVVHPQVQRSVDIDIKFLVIVAWLFDRIGLDHLGASLALRQFASFLATQVDLRVEAKNLKKLRSCFEGSSLDVVVPEVYDAWVSRDALVMDFEEGEALTTLLKASSDCESLKHDAWKTICDAFWSMVFKHKFVHGDLHPGNVLWRRRPQSNKVQLVFLDCGLTIDLGGEAGEDLSVMIKAFLTKTPEEVASLLIPLSFRVGGRAEDVYDPDGFVRGIADLIQQGKACNFKLSKLNAGALMGKSLLLGRHHRVRFDARFVNLGVSSGILQGVAMSLNGNGDILSRMHHYAFGAAVAHVGTGLVSAVGGGDTFKTGPGSAKGPNVSGADLVVGRAGAESIPLDVDALGASLVAAALQKEKGRA